MNPCCAFCLGGRVAPPTQHLIFDPQPNAQRGWALVPAWPGKFSISNSVRVVCNKSGSDSDVVSSDDESDDPPPAAKKAKRTGGLFGPVEQDAPVEPDVPGGGGADASSIGGLSLCMSSRV